MTPYDCHFGKSGNFEIAGSPPSFSFIFPQSQHISGGHGHGHQVASPGEEEVRGSEARPRGLAPGQTAHGRAEPKGERQKHWWFLMDSLYKDEMLIWNHHEPQFRSVLNLKMFDHRNCVQWSLDHLRSWLIIWAHFFKHGCSIVFNKQYLNLLQAESRVDHGDSKAPERYQRSDVVRPSDGVWFWFRAAEWRHIVETCWKPRAGCWYLTHLDSRVYYVYLASGHGFAPWDFHRTPLFSDFFRIL